MTDPQFKQLLTVLERIAERLEAPRTIINSPREKDHYRTPLQRQMEQDELDEYNKRKRRHGPWDRRIRI